MRLLLFLLLLSSLLHAEIAYFDPPEKWDLMNPAHHHSTRVKIGFVEPAAQELPPSLNLAVEEISPQTSLDTYLLAAKKKHLADPHNRWRDLGFFSTRAGVGKLSELESKLPLGNVRRLQLIFIQEGHAYILTAGALKEEFSKFYPAFEKAFKSFTVVPTLSHPLSLEKQTHLASLFAQLKEGEKRDAFEKFQKKLLCDYKEMGSCWQFLVLQEAQNLLLK